MNPASKTEQRNEAAERLAMLKVPQRVVDGVYAGRLCCSKDLDSFVSLDRECMPYIYEMVLRFESETHSYVYLIASIDLGISKDLSFLYVSDDMDEWATDRRKLWKVIPFIDTYAKRMPGSDLFI